MLPVRGQIFKLTKPIFVSVPDKMKELGTAFAQKYKEERRKMNYKFLQKPGFWQTYSKDNVRGFIITEGSYVMLDNIFSINDKMLESEYADKEDFVYKIMILHPTSLKKTSRTQVVSSEYLEEVVAKEELEQFRDAQVDFLKIRIEDPLRLAEYLSRLYK